MKKHDLPDCFAVWYNPYLGSNFDFSETDFLCEQGYADFNLNGINKAEAKRAKKR